MFFACRCGESGKIVQKKKPVPAAIALVLFALLCACATPKARGAAAREPLQTGVIPPNIDGLPESTFKELWAYVIAGTEQTLKLNYPISDVVHFGAEVDRYGHVVDIPARERLTEFGGRVHVSITCGSAGLTHFILEPESRARKTLVSELLSMAAPYDGLNIDMENLPLKDADNFITFLGELRKGLGKKILSVCVPARVKENQTYNYERLAKACDKVFVMAYDEHWSTSAPGPVASMNWCKKVAAYALKTIGKDKLIMGLPFYGRSWGDKSTSRGLVHSTTERLRKENAITKIERENGIPKFKYTVLVTVTVYFEDDFSLATRMKMYEDMGIDYIGFWRMGQESVGVWNLVSLQKKKQ